MPPRLAPRAYRSAGCNLRRRPGIKKDRGTQVGASRRMTLEASSTRVASLLLAFSGAACFVFLAVTAVDFLAMPGLLLMVARAGVCRVLIGPEGRASKEKVSRASQTGPRRSWGRA